MEGGTPLPRTVTWDRSFELRLYNEGETAHTPQWCARSAELDYQALPICASPLASLGTWPACRQDTRQSKTKTRSPPRAVCRGMRCKRFGGMASASLGLRCSGQAGLGPAAHPPRALPPLSILVALALPAAAHQQRAAASQEGNGAEDRGGHEEDQQDTARPKRKVGIERVFALVDGPQRLLALHVVLPDSRRVVRVCGADRHQPAQELQARIGRLHPRQHVNLARRPRGDARPLEAAQASDAWRCH